MTARISALLVVLATTACFSPEPIAILPTGSTGTPPEHIGDSSGHAGEEPGLGSDATTDEGTSTGGESTGETTGDISPSMDSSSTGEEASAESSSSGAPDMEACGYEFSFVDFACRSEAESYCVPEFGNDMQAACEACTNARCESQQCSQFSLAGPVTIWTPVEEGGGHIEQPMGFVDISDTWPRGTIFLGGCSGDRIGEAEF